MNKTINVLNTTINVLNKTVNVLNKTINVVNTCLMLMGWPYHSFYCGLLRLKNYTSKSAKIWWGPNPPNSTRILPPPPQLWSRAPKTASCRCHYRQTLIVMSASVISWQLLTVPDSYWQFLKAIDSNWKLLKIANSCWQVLTANYCQFLTTTDGCWHFLN